MTGGVTDGEYGGNMGLIHLLWNEHKLWPPCDVSLLKGAHLLERRHVTPLQVWKVCEHVKVRALAVLAVFSLDRDDAIEELSRRRARRGAFSLLGAAAAALDETLALPARMRLRPLLKHERPRALDDGVIGGRRSLLEWLQLACHHVRGAVIRVVVARVGPVAVLLVLD